MYTCIIKMNFDVHHHHQSRHRTLLLLQKVPSCFVEINLPTPSIAPDNN